MFRKKSGTDSELNHIDIATERVADSRELLLSKSVLLRVLKGRRSSPYRGVCHSGVPRGTVRVGSVALYSAALNQKREKNSLKPSKIDLKRHLEEWGGLRELWAYDEHSLVRK